VTPEPERGTGRFASGARRELAWAAPVALAAALPLAVVLARGGTLAWGDTAALFAPVRPLVVAALRAFRAPLWNPFEAMGIPLHAQLIHGALHPVSWLTALLAPGGGMDALLVANVVLAGLGAGALARTLGASRAGAAVAGCGYALSGYVLGMSAVLTYQTAAAIAPWVVAGIAVVALFALVAVNRFSSTNSPSTNAMSNAPFAGGAGGAGAVDISSMSPEERAQRLFNRVMRLQSENKMDSVQFFAPMALDAYFALPSMDDDSRYDVGRIAEAVGAFPLAKAQADTILRSSPNDLLGLALAMRVARETKDTQAAGDFAKRLLAAAPKERKKDNAAYKAHAADLDLALKEAAR